MRAPFLPGKAQARLWLPLLPVALLLTACGGGGSDNEGLGPLLQIGMQRQYLGSVTRTTTYVNPTASNPNNTLGYSYTENQTVLQAPAGVNAAFDVQSSTSYSITQDPGIGSVPVSQLVDSYQNLYGSSASQMTSTVGQNTVTVSEDESANALGGGPYYETTTNNTTFPTLRDSFNYPLQTGATMNVPQSASQSINFTDVNGAGAPPPDGSNVGYSRTRSENDDGSFSTQASFLNGNSSGATQNSDGSGSSSSFSATQNVTTALDLPQMIGGVLVLPVARSVTPASTGTTTTTDYEAADWYPNNGQPNSPLVLESSTVVGPTSTLPSQCSGALIGPDTIYEIDTSTTSQSTINASYSVTNTSAFNTDGVTVCTLSQQTAYAYDLTTGAVTSTTTTQTQSWLNAINY